MSLDGSTYTFVPYTINGINTVASPTDIANCVKYNGNTSNTDLGTFNLTTSGTLSAQTLAIPANPTNDESWITYTVSTMGNLSTAGGLITTDLTNGRSMYFTGGVLGAPNFQFATLGTNADKVICTDANGVFSTTINAGQLSYITGLTSQAGGVGQNNTWTGTNNFDTLTSVGALRITSSIANQDYSLSVNAFNQLEINNLATFQTLKTDGASIFLPTGGNVYCSGTTYSNDLQLSGTSYFAYGTGQQWGTNLNGSGEYEIQDDAGVMRLRLSKTSGLTVSTMNITQAPTTTPSFSLGLDGSNQVIKYAVATGAVNVSSTTARFLPYLSTATVLTNSLLNQIDDNSIGLGFTALPNYPFTGSKNIYVNGEGFYGGLTSMVGTFGRNTTSSVPANEINFTANGSGILVSQIKSHSGSSAFYDATWTYSNTNSAPFGANQGQVLLQADKLTLSLTNGLVAPSISTINISASSGSTVSTIANIAQPSTNDVALAGDVFAINLQAVSTSILQTAGLSATGYAGVISGSYTLTPTPTTAPIAGCYSPTQTFSSQKYGFSFAGFSSPIFGVSLTIYQANVGNTARVAISSTYAVATGTFTGTFAPNSNASFLGQVFLEFSGTANKTVSWTSFTYTAGTVAVNGNITQSGNLTTTGTTSVGNRLLGQANAPTDNFWLGLRGTGTEGDRLAIAIRGNGTTGLVSDVLFQKNVAMSAGTAFTHIGGNSGANLLNIQGNDLNNSPYLGFYTANTRRCYIGFASNTEMNIACENNAQLNIMTQGTSRMIIKTNGDVGIGRDPSYRLDVNGAMHVKSDANANDSKTIYGPNATWGAFLVAGSGTDSSGPATAQVISTNGNLHLDGGNNNDIYYGYYPYARGTPNVHRWYGGNYNFDGLPQNGSSFSQVAVFEGNQLKRSQAVNKLVYFSNNVAWGGGVNMTYAFYLYNTACNVQIWGKCSGYYSGAGMMQTTIRVYSQSSGAYYYYPFNSFVNVGYNHFTVPLNYAVSFPTTGWYDFYVYSTSGWITDGNDQLTIGVSVLPAGGF